DCPTPLRVTLRAPRRPWCVASYCPTPMYCNRRPALRSVPMRPARIPCPMSRAAGAISGGQLWVGINYGQGVAHVRAGDLDTNAEIGRESRKAGATLGDADNVT